MMTEILHNHERSLTQILSIIALSATEAISSNERDVSIQYVNGWTGGKVENELSCSRCWPPRIKKR